MLRRDSRPGFGGRPIADDPRAKGITVEGEVRHEEIAVDRLPPTQV